jgi:hypothetical protein
VTERERWERACQRQDVAGRALDRVLRAQAVASFALLITIMAAWLAE